MDDLLRGESISEFLDRDCKWDIRNKSRKVYLLDCIRFQKRVLIIWQGIVRQNWHDCNYGSLRDSRDVIKLIN